MKHITIFLMIFLFPLFETLSDEMDLIKFCDIDFPANTVYQVDSIRVSYLGELRNTYTFEYDNKGDLAKAYDSYRKYTKEFVYDEQKRILYFREYSADKKKESDKSFRSYNELGLLTLDSTHKYDGNHYTDIKKYNNDSLLLYQASRSYSDGTLVTESTTSNEYEENLIKKRISNFYNYNGKNIELFFGRLYEYYYDESKNLDSILTTYYDSESVQDSILNEKTIFIRDSYNNIILRKHFGLEKDGIMTLREIDSMTYNENGRMLKKVVAFVSWTDSIGVNRRFFWNYDERGNIIEYENHHDGTSHHFYYKYNSQNDLILDSTRLIKNDSLVYCHSKMYDYQDHLLKKYAINEYIPTSSRSTRRWTYEYDSNNLIISSTFVSINKNQELIYKIITSNEYYNLKLSGQFYEEMLFEYDSHSKDTNITIVNKHKAILEYTDDKLDEVNISTFKEGKWEAFDRSIRLPNKEYCHDNFTHFAFYAYSQGNLFKFYWNKEVSIDFSAKEELFIGAYPNPFTSFTQIRYTLYEDTSVKLELYDIGGNKLSDLMNEHKTSGVHVFEFVPSANLGSGVYFLKLITNDQTKTVKINYTR